MTDAMFERQVETLELEGSALIEAEALFEWHQQNMTELRQSWEDTMMWIGNGPAERTFGSPPPDLDEDDLPLTFVRSKDQERIEQKGHELRDWVNAEYFGRLAAIAPNHDEQIDRLRNDWRRAYSLREHGGGAVGIDLDVSELLRSIVAIREQTPEMRAILDDWGRQIDRLLIEREQAEREQRKYYDELFLARNGDDEAFTRAARLIFGEAVVNAEIIERSERAIDLLRRQLDEDEAQRLERAWYAARFPLIAYDGLEDAFIETALSRPDLTDAQRDALHDVSTEIDALRARTYPRIERLHAEMSELERRIDEMAASLRAHVTGQRSPQSSEASPDERYREACIEFIDRMEELGRRARAIVRSANGGGE